MMEARTCSLFNKFIFLCQAFEGHIQTMCVYIPKQPPKDFFKILLKIVTRNTHLTTQSFQRNKGLFLLVCPFVCCFFLFVCLCGPGRLSYQGHYWPPQLLGPRMSLSMVLDYSDWLNASIAESLCVCGCATLGGEKHHDK